MQRLACAVMLTVFAGLCSAGSVRGANPAAGDSFSALGVTPMTASTPPAAFDLKALGGASLSSGELAGKVVLLNFWATWCGPCKEEMPSLAQLQSHFDPGRVRVVTVTTDMHPQGIKQFLDQLGVNLPVLFDEDQELSRLFMVRGLPTTVLIDRRGHAIGRAVGPRAWNSQESITLVRQILDHQP